MLQFFNTLTRRKEAFQSITSGQAGIYSCGPTVYGTPHIGNLRAYIFADTLRRTLEWSGYAVTQVINITDVGHLVTDGDGGEDKLEKGAKTTGKTVWEIALMYEAQFVAALDALHIKHPTVMPRATAHIGEQLAMIKELTRKGFTYKTSDGIYFDTAKFTDYGKLGGQKLDEKEAGARVAVKSEKRQPADFALWKFCVGENANHTMRWDYETGADLSGTNANSLEPTRTKIGFPGWHIECSAMSLKYLAVDKISFHGANSVEYVDQENSVNEVRVPCAGPATHELNIGVGSREGRAAPSALFDIHTGGIDHVPVHHENEIAQSEAAFGHPFVNYWLHNDFMTVDGGKMSKSLSNVYTLDDVQAKKIDPLAFRYLCLGTHYRSKLNFTWEGLMGAETALKKLKNEMTGLPVGSEPHAESLTDFTTAIEDDLNTARALAVVWEIAKSTTLAPHVKYATLKKCDDILGLGLDIPMVEEVVTLTAEQAALLAKRAEARANKDWDTSDRIRDEFKKMGLTIKDTPDGEQIVSQQ